MSNVLNIESWLEREHLATQIVNHFFLWKQARSSAEEEWLELRNFIFATDTRSTSTGKNGWSNSTTLPKLTQIRDNLHANYMSALFSNDNWLAWVGEDRDAVSAETKRVITNYMRNRCDVSGFREHISKALYDYIDTGMPIGSAEYVTEYETDENGNKVVAYSGPKAVRISPYDIVFDPTASTFTKASKITRRITTLGELAKEAQDNPSMQYKQEIINWLAERRQTYTTLTGRDRRKLDAITIDGFGTYEQYVSSGMVEILEFEGSIYNIQDQKLLENVTITVVDGAKIIRQVDSVSFMVSTGWRERPDNLWAMGPLANLVGMQYRIDHLENMKADIFDQIAHPTKVVYGDVPVQGELEPGDTIYVGAEGRVDYLHPDATALNADMQIRQLEDKMEMYAGAPREAMGIRSPGEKTMYEVQQLENAAFRIFQHKIRQFEMNYMEPLLNEMFRLAKKYAPIDGTTEKILEPESTIVTFEKISPEQLKATGKLQARGARHFAARQKLIQDLNNFIGSSVGQDADVKVHFSGKEIAKLMNEQLDFQNYKIFQPNVRIIEQAETARLAQSAQQSVATEGNIEPASITDVMAGGQGA